MARRLLAFVAIASLVVCLAYADEGAVVGDQSEAASLPLKLNRKLAQVDLSVLDSLQGSNDQGSNDQGSNTQGSNKVPPNCPSNYMGYNPCDMCSSLAPLTPCIWDPVAGPCDMCKGDFF